MASLNVSLDNFSPLAIVIQIRVWTILTFPTQGFLSLIGISVYKNLEQFRLIGCSRKESCHSHRVMLMVTEDYYHHG